MAWCPKCKNEYREGITVCADCKCELITDYTEILKAEADTPLVNIDKKRQLYADKLTDYLIYSEVMAVQRKTTDDAIEICIRQEDVKKAKRLLNAFLIVEKDSMMQPDEVEVEEVALEADDTEAQTKVRAVPEFEDFHADATAPLDKVLPVQKQKKTKSAVAQYDDYRTSASTFLVIGGAFLIFTILNVLKVISFTNSIFTLTIYFIVSAGFLAFGLYSFIKLPVLKQAADEEKEQIEEMKVWLVEHVTAETLPSFLEGFSEEPFDEQDSEELRYIACIEMIKTRMIKKFPDASLIILDQQIEERMNELQDSDAEIQA